jgi:FkbM family methyltransferase
MGLLTVAGSTVSELIGRNHPLVRQLRPSYEWLLDAASGKRGIEWSVNGEPFRIDPRVRRLVARVTEPELWEYLRAQVGPHERILDVGAFLGAYSVMMARWGGETTRVLAFEPTPTTLPLLRRHVALNKVADRVEVIEHAVGAEAGFVELHEHSDPYRNAVGASDPNGTARGTSRVAVTTLDDACSARNFSPTLLRMDVQGFEHAVLRGAREIIRNGRGKLRIVLEVHPQLWPLQGIDERSFDALLEELGLRAVPLLANRPRYEPDGHVTLEYV